MLDQIKIVLVEPSHPGNIGGAARAMKTMGLSRLSLVNPQRFPDPQADWRAAGALDVLDTAEVVSDVAQSIADSHFVIGTSTRLRHVPWPVITPREIWNVLAQQPQSAQVAILFGREDSGLTNEELQRCQCHLQIPASPVYGSLNLAMAVQVVAYELFGGYDSRRQDQAPLYSKDSIDGVEHDGAEAEQAETDSPLGRRIWDKPPANQQQFEGVMQQLEETLYASGFVDPNYPGYTMTRLRRMFVRQQLDQTEVQILRGVLRRLSATKRT